MEAQQQIQDALRAGMGSQPQQPQEQQQQPMMPMGPQLDPMQAMMQQQMMQQQMMQQMMPQQMMPQQMMPQQMMPQQMMPQQMPPQPMMQPQQFARGGAVWQRKEGKNPEGGLNAAGRASLKAQGHDIKPPVSAKQAKKSPKAAARRKSFCARMGGMPGPMKDDKGEPTRKALALRKWDC
jgi:hypothetical protein